MTDSKKAGAFVLRASRVVTPTGIRAADVHVSDGRFTAIGAPGSAPASATIVDAGDAMVLPGLVDSHIHINEPGRTDDFNPELEKAWRVADFLELGELMCQDALAREESCGGHFREEHQTEKGEAQRNDKDFMFVSAWEWKGEDVKAELHKEKLEYEEVKVAQRSYE